MGEEKIRKRKDGKVGVLGEGGEVMMVVRYVEAVMRAGKLLRL